MFKLLVIKLRKRKLFVSNDCAMAKLAAFLLTSLILRCSAVFACGRPNCDDLTGIIKAVLGLVT
jgi:hypothetical protein